MAKRTLKSSSKSTSSQAKANKPVERGTGYERLTASTQHAVRDVSSLAYERNTTTGESTPPAGGRSVPATQAKNRFGEILETVRDSGPVFIERHGQTQAVVLGIDTYNKLTSNERSSQERELDYWTREFDALYARMQTPEASRAVDALFSATDAELNRRNS